MTEGELKKQLLEAAQAAVTATPARTPDLGDPGVPKGTRWGVVGGGLAVIALLAGYVLGTRPAWIYPTEALAETTEITAASMRLALVRERQRVETFRQVNGRLPVTLAEAGAVSTNVEMLPWRGGGYLLRLANSGVALELRSDEPLEDFLGNSLQLILDRQRGTP